MGEHFVAKTSELSNGERKLIKIDRLDIGVFYKDGAYYGYENRCIHQGGPACEGILINKVVEHLTEEKLFLGESFSDVVHFVCPWHGYEFDLKTGECVGDRSRKLKKYNVVERDGAIYVVV